MTYTVQLDFFIDEDVVRTDEEVKNVLEEIFDSCATSVSDIKVIDVNDQLWVKQIENKDHSLQDGFGQIQIIVGFVRIETTVISVSC